MRFSRIGIFCCTLLLPISTQATFIEATMGAAVVNDATATVYNPAALTLMKRPQIIGLGSYARFNTQFNGTTQQTFTGFTQSGNSSSTTNYFLPALYMGFPVTENVTVGLAVVTNFFNRNIDDASILRYVQASNSVEDIDVIPAIGYKVNEYLALGAGLNLSYAQFDLDPISGSPAINIPDSQSSNQSSASGIGYDAGLLFKPRVGTLIGFNYRSAVTYKLSGRSVLYTNPVVVSNNYQSTIWTPARIVLSASQFLTAKFALIATLQRVQSSILDTVHVSGALTLAGTRPLLVNAYIPYYMQDSWIYTFGANYRFTPRFILRAAASYLQSPGNSHYQIVNGDSLVLGMSAGYEWNTWLTVDGSYAHAFMRGEDIFITQGRNQVAGVNRADRDSVTLKVTFNV